MIRTDKLKGLIVEKGFSQTDVAKNIGITPKTFYDKMSRGVFRSDEIQIMINMLDIKDPTAIFFTHE